MKVPDTFKGINEINAVLIFYLKFLSLLFIFKLSLSLIGLVIGSKPIKGVRNNSII